MVSGAPFAGALRGRLLSLYRGGACATFVSNGTGAVLIEHAQTFGGRGRYGLLAVGIGFVYGGAWIMLFHLTVSLLFYGWLTVDSLQEPSHATPNPSRLILVAHASVFLQTKAAPADFAVGRRGGCPPLAQLVVGDVVTLTTPAAIFDYRIETIEIVEPTRVDVLDPSTERLLTLVTCYPFNVMGPAPLRMIARGRLSRVLHTSIPAGGPEGNVSSR